MNLTSLQNPRVKDAVRLRDRRHRDREKRTLVEGREEVLFALEAGVELVSLFLSERALEMGAKALLGGRVPERNLFETAADAFAKVAYRENPDGWLAVVKVPGTDLRDIAPGPGALILVIDGVEKPGNLGAMARTADAAGVDAIVLCGAGTDPWNPNAIRASRGAIFATPIASAGPEEVLQWLEDSGVRLVLADPSAGSPYTSADLAGSVAIVVGAEHSGLSDAWRGAAAQRVCIPMAGRINSLNVATSAALVLYEAVRQRTGQAPVAPSPE